MEENKKDMSYEQACSDLEEIIRKLESGEASLDESIALYTRGMELASICRSKLDEIVSRISALSADGETETPFEE
ncbi:MAG: exodeoxyribonuclease VII small subunit [Clostridiales bacterium]|nr:exodeoxyribonuclease VII small subunit [Clostridiales bacterium]